MTSTLERVAVALRRAFVSQCGQGRLLAGRPYYVRSLEDNLIPGVRLADFWSDLAQGDGDELGPRGDAPPKFCALYSSSALAVNAFARFKCNPDNLRLAAVTGFESIGFEFKCQNGLRGKKPNLDLLAYGGRAVVGVESKFTEPLSSKVAAFSPVYEPAVRAHLTGPWAQMYDSLQQHPDRFSHLDAAQLVKHALGLAHHFRTSSSPKVLLYLYWDPANARALDEYRCHADEVTRFCRDVRGAQVRFVSMSYRTLWQYWRTKAGSRELKVHADRLAARYDVEI